jgi:hypothetical protein
MRKTLVCIMMIGAVLWMGQSLYAHPQSCANCHVPHNAAKATDPKASWGVPLWNTQYTSNMPTFTLYSSPTFSALGTDIAQPNGSSKMCLGCHDGTYSTFQNSPANPMNFGTDLSTSHPISFTYDSALAGRTPIPGDLRDPSVALSGLPGGGTIAQDLLDEKGMMQCTSCHDIHANNPDTTYSLRYAWNPSSGNDAVMCQVCHNK